MHEALSLSLSHSLMSSLGKLHHSWLRVLLHKLKSVPKPKKSFASMEVPKQLKQVFSFMDFNGDGKISSLELGELLSCLGHEKSTVGLEAEQILREADRDGDGFIDFDEFLHVFRGRIDDDQDLMEAFRVFDVDGNGFISAEEVRRVLVGLGHGECSLRQCRLMIRGVDKNGDGLVDFEEFRSMMMATSSGN